VRSRLLYCSWSQRLRGASQGDPHAVKVSVGYADTLRAPAFTPSPWAGDPGVTFIGTGAPWGAGALKLENPSANALTVTM
jgi:hypothetical protein